MEVPQAKNPKVGNESNDLKLTRETKETNVSPNDTNSKDIHMNDNATKTNAAADGVPTRKRRRRQRRHSAKPKDEQPQGGEANPKSLNTTQESTETPQKKKRKRRPKKKAKTEDSTQDSQHKTDWRGFSQGNYNTYYNYRLANQGGDESQNKHKRHGDRRFNYFKKEWFAGKDVLDMGCNAGFVTIGIAEKFLPKSILGIDVDSNLIDKAKSSLKSLIAKRYSNLTGETREKVNADWKLMIEQSGEKIPVINEQASDENTVNENENDTKKHDDKTQENDKKVEQDKNQQNTEDESKKENISPLLSVFLSKDQKIHIPPPIGPSPFPYNVSFLCEDFMMDTDGPFEPQFDVIVCLSVTKWIHLNHGDDGIKRLFKKFSALLRPNGLLILEPQKWKGYKKRSRISETTYFNYKHNKLRPNDFSDILTTEANFESVDLLYVPETSKGFDRPIYAFWKGSNEKKEKLEDPPAKPSEN